MLTFVFCERNEIKKRKNAPGGEKDELFFFSYPIVHLVALAVHGLGGELVFVCCC